MQLQPPASQPTANSSSIIQQSQLTILYKKLQIMQLTCSTFYSNQHRCILSHIIYLTLQQKRRIIPVEDTRIFVNAVSLLVDLKQGYFIVQSYGEINGVEKKQSKKQKHKFLFFKLNINGFFKIIRKILMDIQGKFEKIMKLYQQEEKRTNINNINDAVNNDNNNNTLFQVQKKARKKCKKCYTIQNQYLTQFGWIHCTNQITIHQSQKIYKTQCGSTQFQDFFLSIQQKNRIQKIKQIIQIIYVKIKQIQDLQYKLQNKMEQIKEIQKEIKVKEIDRFMKKYQDLLEEKKIQVKLNQNDYQVVKQAEKWHKPKLQYEKVKMMKMKREKQRQRSRSKLKGEE